MIICQACGTHNPAGTTYCTKCARKLDEATQRAVAQQRSTHSATGVRWSAVAAALIILILIVLLVALFVTHVI